MNPGRRALGRLPELEVPRGFFDDRGMLHGADDAQEAGTLGTGERIRSPGLADQACPGPFAMAAEVVRFGFGCRDGNGSDVGSAWLSLAAQSTCLITVRTALPDNLLSLPRDIGGGRGQGMQGREPLRGG
jgi:hypothetical protein